MPILTPAYGRDYKSKAEVLAALNQRMDFIFNDPTSRWDGLPCTPSDLELGSITVRYKKRREKMIAKFKEGVWV